MKLTLAAALGLVTSAMASPMDCDFSKMIQPATASAKFEDPGVIVWCNTIIRDDPGRSHLLDSRWQTASTVLAKHPATLISFNFEEFTTSSRSEKKHAALAPIESHVTPNYDFATGEIVHYRDGEVIETSSFPLGLPVAFDSYSFGNWADSTGEEGTGPRSFRNFVGCVDEFAILSRALSSGEIASLYQNGKP